MLVAFAVPLFARADDACGRRLPVALAVVLAEGARVEFCTWVGRAEADELAD